MAMDKWKKETEALKKIQVQFEFMQEVTAAIIHDAADNHIKSSDMVRKLVGLPYTKIQRARFGLSLDKNDLKYLADRFNLDTFNEKEIRRRVMEEVNMHYHNKWTSNNAG